MKTETPEQGYSHARIAPLFTIAAAASLLAAVAVNPWSGALYRSDVVNFADVMLGFFKWALIFSILFGACSALLRRSTANWVGGVSVLILTIGAIVLSDRLLLARTGLPLWMADESNHFKHRPGATRKWGGGAFQHKLIHINEYGFHDDDFPLEKPTDEIRGVVLGDSITMGHGVTLDETFTNKLEAQLNAAYGARHSFQIINAGVQGYATFQEYNMFVDSLKFRPDFAVVQFCLNDLTEPFVVEERFGGTGVHYHGIAETSSKITGYLLNETGYGRLVQGIMDRGKTVENERKWEIYKVEAAARSEQNDPTFAESWRVTLTYLDKIVEVARNNNIPLLLLIAPHTFQLLDEGATKPQKILLEYARAQGIEAIDLTTVLTDKIVDRSAIAEVRRRGFSEQEIEDLYEKRIRKYFLDQDHYTPAGHDLVAAELFTVVTKMESLKDGMSRTNTY